MKERTYFCIDMKSFFASVECAERGLNPFETNLIVADESRGNGTICLAITPKMKSLGVRNRCRRYEIPKGIQYITAMPRMQKYIDYAAEIYGIYLQYIDKQDIHVYSIDESFIDATDYLPMYHKTPKEFAKMLIDEIAEKLHIPATAGIGTNLYLAKIALDITAKKVPDHMGYLNEELFRETLWHHRPLTDFWGISTGTVRRLERRGIVDMAGIANYPSEILYKDFGINAELLIDHSWGRESCLMSDIKNYKSKSKSVSSSQVLFSDYTFDKAKIVVEEMVRSGCLELMRRKVIASHITVTIGYSKDCHAPTGGRVKIGASTNLPKKIMPSAMRVFEQTTDRNSLILPYFWIPEDTIDLRVRRDHVPYDTWLGRGQVIATEGNVIHYGYIENFIEDLGTKYHIKEIAFDRWGAVQMVQNLEGMGFTVVPFGQGFKDMSPPTKELMKLVLEEKIAHGGHPVLRWMMDNIFIRTDPAGNIKPDKEKSTEKIDGAVATIMALDRAIRCGNDTSASVYDNRGILFL